MNIEYVGFWDLILVPVYIVFIFFILSYIRKRHSENFLIQHYLFKGMAFKIVCALFYALLIYFYYGYGDTLSYYRAGMEMRHAISNGTEGLGIFFKDAEYIRNNFDTAGKAEAGLILEKFILILSYFSFGRFLVITILMAALSFAGIFKMFQAFCLLMPSWHKRISYIVLFFPSVTVYGSGILKDTVCLAALGWIIYYCTKLMKFKTIRLREIMIIVLCCILIGIIKIYILAGFIVPFLIFMIINGLNKIKNNLLKQLLKPVISGILIIIYLAFAQNIQSALGSYATDNLINTVVSQQENYKKLEEESGSFFEIGPMEESFSGFLKKTPVGIATTLFRPFLWEVRNFMMLLSAFENLFILLFTIYVLIKIKFFKFFNYIFSNPFIFLCIIYSILFAALVGVSTLNFGTLVRYRIPILPFYLSGLLYMLYLNSMSQKTATVQKHS